MTATPTQDALGSDDLLLVDEISPEKRVQQDANAPSYRGVRPANMAGHLRRSWARFLRAMIAAMNKSAPGRNLRVSILFETVAGLKTWIDLHHACGVNLKAQQALSNKKLGLDAKETRKLEYEYAVQDKMGTDFGRGPPTAQVASGFA